MKKKVKKSKLKSVAKEDILRDPALSSEIKSVVSEAGGGLVKIFIDFDFSGEGEKIPGSFSYQVARVEIDQSLISKKNKSFLEKLVGVAVQDGLTKSFNLVREENLKRRRMEALNMFPPNKELVERVINFLGQFIPITIY